MEQTASGADAGTTSAAELDGDGHDDTVDSGAGRPDAEGADPAGDEADAATDGMRTVSARDARRVIRTAQLELEVEDPARVADEIVAVAERAGGFVAETDLQRDNEGTVRGSITLRVPSHALFTAVEELDALAVAVPVRRIDERDVTAETTDLRAALTNLTAYEAELRTLLADVRETTTRPDDLLTVFERIRSVRAEIDQAEARLAVLDDQVALSTIQVSLRPAASAVPIGDPSWAPGETLRNALDVTSRTLARLADAAIVFVVTVLPIGLLLTSPVLLGVVVWRHRRGHQGPADPGQPAAAPPPAPTPSVPPAP